MKRKKDGQKEQMEKQKIHLNNQTEEMKVEQRACENDRRKRKGYICGGLCRLSVSLNQSSSKCNNGISAYIEAD